MTFWPDQLVDAIARRRSVILIGSGVSANSQTSDGVRPPTWGAFLNEAHSLLEKKKRYISQAIDNGRYLDACYFLKKEHGNNWIPLLNKKFLHPKYIPAEIHKAIFNLDSRIVASLNFDKIYENYALPASESTCIIKNYYDDDIRQVVAGNDRYILKPHGTIDTPSKLIFTVEDYAKNNVTHAYFYEMMAALLHTHTFISIGCGLSDPDMQWMFEDYRYKYSESPHYITLPTPISDVQKEMLKTTRGLNVLPYSTKDNHKELTDRLKELNTLVTTEREKLIKSINW